MAKKFFSSPKTSGLALGSIQAPNQCKQGAFIPEAKQLGREAGHSPPSSVEINDVQSYGNASTISQKHL
jgi:hypothetical protein